MLYIFDIDNKAVILYDKNIGGGFMVNKIVAIIVFIFCCFFMAEMGTQWLIIFIAAVGAYAFFVYFSLRKKDKDYKQKIQDYNEEEKSDHTIWEKEGQTVAVEEEAYHISGLPGTSNEKCVIDVKTKMIVFDCSGHFELPMERVKGANVSPQIRTIQTYNTTTKNKPSLGGAVAGGILFGAPGAIVGGMSGKSKTKTTVQEQNVVEALYITIDYINAEGLPAQLVFKGGRNSNLYDLGDKINTYAGHVDSVL